MMLKLPENEEHESASSPIHLATDEQSVYKDSPSVTMWGQVKNLLPQPTTPKKTRGNSKIDEFGVETDILKKIQSLYEGIELSEKSKRFLANAQFHEKNSKKTIIVPRKLLGNTQITDSGDLLTVRNMGTKAAAQLLTEISIAKGFSKVELSGGLRFQAQTARLMLEAGIEVESTTLPGKVLEKIRNSVQKNEAKMYSVKEAAKEPTDVSPTPDPAPSPSDFSI